MISCSTWNMTQDPNRSRDFAEGEFERLPLSLFPPRGDVLGGLPLPVHSGPLVENEPAGRVQHARQTDADDVGVFLVDDEAQGAKTKTAKPPNSARAARKMGTPILARILK